MAMPTKSRFLLLPTELQGLIFDNLFYNPTCTLYRIRCEIEHLRDFFDVGESPLRELFLRYGRSDERVFWPIHPHLAVNSQWRMAAMRSFFRWRVFAFRATERDLARLKDVPKEWRDVISSICLRVDLGEREEHAVVEQCVREILALLPNLRYLRLDIRGVAAGWNLKICEADDTIRRTPFQHPFTDLPWTQTIAKHPRLRYFSTKHESDWGDWGTVADNPRWSPDTYRLHRLEWYVRICIAARRHSADPDAPVKGILHWKDHATGWERFCKDCGQCEHPSLNESATQGHVVEFLGELFKHQGCEEGVGWCRAKAQELF